MKESSAKSQKELVHIRGNAHADVRAKLGAQKHLVLRDVMQNLFSEVDAYSALPLEAAQVSELYRPLREILGSFAKAPKPPVPRPVVSERLPVWPGTYYKCAKCFVHVSPKTIRPCR